MRSNSISVGQFNLRLAYTNYVAAGTVQPNGSFKPYVFTNAISVSGASYPCVVAMEIRHGFGKGTLAMTTNEVFVWIESGRPPRILPSPAYRAPYFPPGF